MMDASLRGEFERALCRARGEGLDLLETLDRAGLLRTPAAVRGDRVGASQRLVEALDRVGATEVLRRHFPGRGGSATPADMYRACVTFLSEMCDAIAKEKA